MKPVKVTCDSACDLSGQLYQQYDITPIPLGIQLGKDTRQDGVDVMPGDIYAYMDRTGQIPRTTAPSAAEYQQRFSEYIEQGYQVVHISPSSVLSPLYRNACAAAEHFPQDVFVVDSRNISSGSGHLAILGVELSHASLNAREIASALEDMKQRMDTSFLLSSPEYFYRQNPRGFFPLLRAKLQRSRPALQIQGGKLTMGKRFGGDWENALSAFLRSKLESRPNIQHDRLFLTHTGIAPEWIKKTVDLIQDLQSFDDIIVTTASCAFSCQSGPGSLGIHYLRTC